MAFAFTRRPIALNGGAQAPAWADIFAITPAAGETFDILQSPEDSEVWYCIGVIYAVYTTST